MHGHTKLEASIYLLVIGSTISSPQKNIIVIPMLGGLGCDKDTFALVPAEMEVSVILFHNSISLATDLRKFLKMEPNAAAELEPSFKIICKERETSRGIKARSNA
ncbi:hypothetical protein L6164_033339 [Bauhinia variegata]|uniref:Uncharacterized protein n=1 Tax=Bauhinia variegata TaxID=167791 RepID=A0ACB9KRE4_BAUVA|nr:hypothetical protein L6164_033339 [Bauhinia variegata]